MGAKLSFEEGSGPHISNQLRTVHDVDAMRSIEPESDLKQVMSAVKMIRKELPETTALIGFAGAPFTLASYWVEGGKPDPFVNLKTMMYREPGTFRSMLAKLGETVSRTLTAIVKAGADAIQVFDTWGGVLAKHEFREYNLPVLKGIFAQLRPLGVPMTYFVKDGGHLLSEVKETGADVIGIDWRTSFGDARKVFGKKVSVQGNLDPTVLFGDEKTIRRETRRVLEEAKGQAGHIFNLGHGILPKTPIQSVEFLIDEIRCAR